MTIKESIQLCCDLDEMAKRVGARFVPDKQKIKALIDGQERLGKEFEKVLFDNLWELYAR